MLLCEICGKELPEQPIIVSIYRHDGVTEMHQVCSETCEQELREREQGSFSGYDVDTLPVS